MSCLDIECNYDSERRANYSLKTDNALALISGPSGGGKTTLLEMVMGVVKPDSGYVSLGGKLFFDSRQCISVPARGRGIGVQFQDLRLFPHLTVEKNIFIPYVSLRDDRVSFVRELTGKLALEPLYDRKIDRLSGGEKRRVAFCRALCLAEHALILDEPFAELDSASVKIMMGALVELLQANMPMLIASHRLGDFEAIAENYWYVEGFQIRDQKTLKAVGYRV